MGFGFMKSKVTIRDVADAAGVSVTTVSQILNGKGKRFSKATQEKVFKVRDDLHYIPDFNAQNLIHRSSKMIGVLVPSIGNPFFSTFIKGILSVCRKERYVPLIFGADQAEDLERYYLESLIRRSVDGLIIASPTITPQTIDELLMPNKIPYIVLDQNPENNGDRVKVNDYQGGALVAEHLVQLGHKNIVMVLPNQMTENIHDRYLGFKNTLDKHGVKFDMADDVIHDDLSLEGGCHSVENILKKDPTAVFCANDELAIGVYRGMHERGIVIPDQISVIGYDNIDLDEYVTPKLTTISQPIRSIGETSAQLIIKRINHPNIGRQLVNMDVHLVVRESTEKV